MVGTTIAVFVAAEAKAMGGNTNKNQRAYIDAVPADRVVQVHLAGHTDKGTHLLDTHSDHVGKNSQMSDRTIYFPDLDWPRTATPAS